MRAPGLTWFRLPLFIWANYATGVVIMLGTPVIAITLFLIGVERVWGVVRRGKEHLPIVRCEPRARRLAVARRDAASVAGLHVEVDNQFLGQFIEPAYAMEYPHCGAGVALWPAYRDDDDHSTTPG